MKTLLATSAILIATAFSAQAETLQQAINTAVSEYLEESITFVPTATEISDVAAAAANQWNVDHAGDALTTAYDDIDHLQDSIVYITGMYNNLNKSLNLADAREYDNMGNVFATEKLTDLYQQKSVSYDKGQTFTTFEGNTLVGASINGNYHNYNVGVVLELANASEKGKLQALIHIVNDKAYNEGYKDGFNDGFEIGFNKGYATAVSDIRIAANPL